MITPSELNAKYKTVEPYLAPLHLNARETLSVFCEKNQFALVSRLKTLESVSEKVESGRFATWSGIDDLVAFTIVIPTLAEEHRVIEFLEEKFRTVYLKRRGSSMKPPDVFRFDSTRFAGKLRVPPGEATERPIDQITFEVQVRTAFDHAWVVTTHALAYKAAVIDWKQQRLAAELKATAEKMDLLIVAFTEASARVEESPWPVIGAKKAVQQFFASAASANRFPRELVPKDWSRFTDNAYELARRCDPQLKPGAVATLIIDAVGAELNALGPDKVPLSLSLWQFTLAALAKKGVLNKLGAEYWPLITAQLEDLYPTVKAVSPRFDLGT